jgi:Ca2+-binding RTX toxin-like protein
MRITKQALSAGTVAAAVATLALAGGAPAQAKGTGEARVVGDTIQYLAGPENNRIMLDQIDGYFVIDDVVKIVPGPGCYQAPGIDNTIVHCDATRIDLIHLDLGDGQDWVGSRHVAPKLKVPLWLVGGPGQDSLYGEIGADRIDGGDDNDYVYGRGGDDRLAAGTDDGMNAVVGGDGNDALYGGPNYDHLDGEAGNDILFGGGDGDALLGGAGSDALLGGDGRDYLQGEEGDDKLDGGPGNNELDGGANRDSCTNGPVFTACEVIS